MVVFIQNDEIPTNADAVSFTPNHDLFYYTGIDQPGTFLVLVKSKQVLESHLFITRPDPLTTVWTGKKLTKSQARSLSGCTHIHWTSQYEKLLRSALSKTKRLYLPLPEASHLHYRSPIHRLQEYCKIEFPSVEVEKRTFRELRLTKSSFELQQIKKAVSITDAGFREVAKALKAGMWEYEIEAILSKSFVERGANGFAYEPIVASGANACILHYTTNHQQCRKGEVVLLDVGARYGGYAADLTRVLPVSGTFSPRQRAVYQAVLDVLKMATSLLTDGLELELYKKEVASEMERQLCKLKLITTSDIRKQTSDEPAYKKYFMHGISHQLGLDVHDVGGQDTDCFRENMVITVEPGIYIPEERLGIRLENDVVIQKNGIIDLMAEVPIEIDQIEAMSYAN